MEMKRPLGTSEGAILEQWAGEGVGGEVWEWGGPSRSA